MTKPVSGPSESSHQPIQSKSILQTTTSAIRQMISGCVYLVYAPPKWLFDTAYYYLIGYGKGSQAPSNWNWSYNNKDMKDIYWKGTKPILEAGCYQFGDKKVPIWDLKDSSVAKTEKQSTFWSFSTAYKDQEHNTKIDVINRDALYAGFDLKKQGYNPALLNPANATDPGGGYKGGARAMEEDICRRSGLSYSIDPEHKKVGNFYPLKNSDLLYTPDCPIFRYGRDRQYALMPQPETLSVITSAAINLGDKNEQTYRKNHTKFLEETERRVYSQLWMAAKKGHDAVVLTAFGCGAFQNNPTEIAKIYQNVIDTRFKGVFKNITFAIIDDHNANKAHNPEGNFKPFYELFTK